MKFARCVFHSRQVDFLILFQNANLMLFFCSEAFRGFLLPEGYSTNCLAGRARPFTLWPQSTVSAFFSTLAPNVPIDNSCPMQCRRPGFDPWVRKIPWRKEWLPTPKLLPGEFLGQRSQVGYNPWDCKEWDMTEPLIY